MTTEERVLINIALSLRDEFPIYTRYDQRIEFDLCDNIPSIKINMDKFNENAQLMTLVSNIVALYDLKGYHKFKISIRFHNYLFNRINSIYDMYGISLSGTTITFTCDQCSLKTSIYADINIKGYVENLGYICCTKGQISEKVRKGFINSNRFELFKKYFETESINKGKFKLRSIYTVQCKKNHITVCSGSNGGNMTAKMCDELYTCWMCENKLDEQYEFFKILKEMGAKYSIEELKTSETLPGLDRGLKRVCKCIIRTYNDKKHLTGKIVFMDFNGEQQAKANSNNLVFRWLEIKYINDRDYCKTFFHHFYKEIVERHNLIKGE